MPTYEPVSVSPSPCPLCSQLQNRAASQKLMKATGRLSQFVSPFRALYR